jgi:WD40 repeat protein
VCRLYSVDDSAVLRDWDVDTGQCIASMPAHELGIKCVVARDGLVMTGSLDMSVKIWDASSFSCAATLDCVGDSVMRLEIVAGNWLLAAGCLPMHSCNVVFCRLQILKVHSNMLEDHTSSIWLADLVVPDYDSLMNECWQGQIPSKFGI